MAVSLKNSKKRLLKLKSNLTISLKRIKVGKDFPVFVVFLVISSVLWVLKTLNKDYESTLDMAVHYVDLPDGFIFNTSPKDKIRVVVRASGTTIWKFNNMPSSVRNVNLQEVIKRNRRSKSGEYFYLTSNLKGRLERHLGTDADIAEIYPDTLWLDLQKLATKILPVRPEVNISYKQQYILSGPVKVTPSSVRVFGYGQSFDTLRFVKTENLKLKNIDDTVVKRVKLSMLGLNEMEVKEVKVEIPVEKFTEKRVDVEVTGSNFPDSMLIKSFPGKVPVTFFVGLSRYKEVSAKDFKVYLDYNELQGKGSGSAPLNISVKDSFVYNVKTTLEKVDYLIEIVD